MLKLLYSDAQVDGNITPTMDNETDFCEEILKDSAGPPPMYHKSVRVTIAILLSIFVIVSVLGNLLVIMAVATHRKLRNLTNTFVVSLAAADCLVAIMVMPFGIYQQFNNKHWLLGDTVCYMTASIDVMFTTTSIFHLSCMAGDRYLAICNPFFYSEKITKKTVALMLGVIWVIPVFISFLPIMNKWNHNGIEDFVNCAVPEGDPICYFVVNMPFAFICSLIAFYIPTIFMILCYWRIYTAATKHARQIRSLEMAAQHNSGKARAFRQETKAAKTLGIIMGVYCCCWFPFFIINVVDPIVGYKIHYVPWTVALWLGYVNSMINPFLYGFFNRSFKRAFIRIFRLRLCRNGYKHDDSGMTGASQVSD